MFVCKNDIKTLVAEKRLHVRWIELFNSPLTPKSFGVCEFCEQQGTCIDIFHNYISPIGETIND